MKTLQGNLDFYLIRTSRGPFHLKLNTQGPSHIHIPEGKLLLRCWRKVGLPLQSKSGNQLSSADDMGWTDLSSCCFTEIDVPLDWDRCRRESLDFRKGCQAPCCIWCRTWDGYGANAGKCASSWVDFGYTNLFFIPEVTSLFFSSCNSVVGDSIEFHQGNRGSLRVWLGTRNFSACHAGELGLILRWVGSVMSFLELWQAPGIYSRVTAGMAIWNSGLFSDVITPSS